MAYCLISSIIKCQSRFLSIELRVNATKDKVDNTLKGQVVHNSHKLPVDQSVKPIKKDTEASRPPQQMNDTGRIIGKSTTFKRIKFDITGKSGVKLPSLALINLEVEKNFMSYGTWVLCGQPTLDKTKTTIQASGKSSEECIGMNYSSFSINSQPLEGES